MTNEPRPDAEPHDPQPVLERQRQEHPPPHPELVDDEGVAQLVNNVGDDGDAATG